MKAKKEPMQFTKDQQVQWASQAAGSTTTKVGTIVKVVPARGLPNVGQLASQIGAKSSYGGGFMRDHESYVVLVPHPGKGKPTLYWPLVSALRLVQQDETKAA